MIEEYIDIKGFEDSYKISNFGNIISKSRIQKRRGKEFLSKEIFLKKVIDVQGYYVVSLSKNNTQKTYRIHQLVSIAFLGHVPDKFNRVVDHIDGNPLNNRVDNLRIVTSYENSVLGFRKDKERATSKYPGVFFSIKDKRLITHCVVNKENKYLGSFDNELDAANKYIEFKNSTSRGGAVD